VSVVGMSILPVELSLSNRVITAGVSFFQ